MASFFRNTFDNLLNNISSSIHSASNTRFPTGTPRTSTRPRAPDRPRRPPPPEYISTPISNRTRNCPYSGPAPPPYFPSQQNPHHGTQTTGRGNMNSNTNHPSQNATQPNLNTASQNVDKLDIQDIRDVSDINNLSAKQLKTILTRNCVEYKGIFEKEVLREKVMQLWIDHNERLGRRRANRVHASDTNRSRDSLDDIDDSQLCKICMEREIDCVLLECGHYLTCVTCGRKLAECPICRQNITRCVRTFRG